jgi:outer membrane protein assembly factor BamB
MKSVRVSACCLLLGFAPAAFAITVTTDAGAGPESITAAPDGGLILGSSSKPTIYRAAKNATKAEPWIDVSADGAVSFLGVMSDVRSNTLWACELGPRSAPGAPSPSAVLSFDLATGKPKSRWKLPGDSSVCNDITIGPDHAAYISDTLNSTIYRIAPGKTEGDVFIKNRTLDGIDGLCFLDGVLYANNVSADTIWRIPIDGSGKAGNPVNIWTDQPIKGPDGMRAAGGHLFIAENQNGRASMLTITGDIAHLTVVQTGLKTPTAIEPAGDILWVGDRANDNATSIPMPH